jgi:hypothetical protein
MLRSLTGPTSLGAIPAKRALVHIELREPAVPFWPPAQFRQAPSWLPALSLRDEQLPGRTVLGQVHLLNGPVPNGT